jgi:hypothetical protein
MGVPVPHVPWFVSNRVTVDGLSVIENGTYEGCRIAECEAHIADFIVQTVNGAAPKDGVATLPGWALEEIFELAQAHVMQMPTRNPQRRAAISRAFAEARKYYKCAYGEGA